MQYKKLNLIFGLSAVALLSSGCSDSNPLDTTPPMVTTLNASFTKDVGNSDAARATMIEPGDTITIDLVANEAILLPPLRLATLDEMATSDEGKFTAQSEFPTITGSGANWTYTYRVAENFGFTEAGEITIFPFRVRDIAGNLSEEPTSAFTSAQQMFTFLPDLEPPSLVGGNNEITINRSALPDANNNFNYTITLTASEEIQEPTGRLGSGDFVFVRSEDSKTWTGTAPRIAAAAAETQITISLKDLGGNVSVFRKEVTTGNSGEIGIDQAPLVLLSGIAPFHILNADGFGKGSTSIPYQSHPVVITYPGQTFAGGVETVGEDASGTLQWSLGDDGILTLTFLQDTAGFSLFTTQFFPNDIPQDEITDKSPRAVDPAPNLSDYKNGQFVFEIMVPDYVGYATMTGKIDHTIGGFCPCDQDVGTPGDGEWETVKWELPLQGSAELNLTTLKTGLVLWPDASVQHGDGNKELVIMLRNMRFEATVTK